MKKDEKALEHVPHNPTPSDALENPPETKLATDELTPEVKAKLDDAPKLAARPAKGFTRGKVHEHGAIHHDGKVFPAGAVVDLPDEVVEQVGSAFIPE